MSVIALLGGVGILGRYDPHDLLIAILAVVLPNVLLLCIMFGAFSGWYEIYATLFPSHLEKKRYKQLYGANWKAMWRESHPVFLIETSVEVRRYYIKAKIIGFDRIKSWPDERVRKFTSHVAHWETIEWLSHEMRDDRPIWVQLMSEMRERDNAKLG